LANHSRKCNAILNCDWSIRLLLMSHNLKYLYYSKAIGSTINTGLRLHCKLRFKAHIRLEHFKWDKNKAASPLVKSLNVISCIYNNESCSIARRTD